MDNSDLSKLIRRQFLQALSERLPQFEPQGGKGKISLSGWRSFIWSVADDLHFFMGLGVDASGAMFTAEAAWNVTPDYPAGQTPLIMLNLAQEHLDQPEMVLRLGIRDREGVIVEKTWWEPRVAEAKEVLKLIEDAVGIVQQEFLPVFVKRAARKGIRLGE